MLESTMTLGELLEDWRINKARLSKTEAGARCGLTPQHWWLLANDQRPNVSGETIDKLADGTGYSLESLLSAAHRTRQRAAEHRMAVPA